MHRKLTTSHKTVLKWLSQSDMPRLWQEAAQPYHVLQRLIDDKLVTGHWGTTGFEVTITDTGKEIIASK